MGGSAASAADFARRARRGERGAGRWARSEEGALVTRRWGSNQGQGVAGAAADAAAPGCKEIRHIRMAYPPHAHHHERTHGYTRQAHRRTHPVKITRKGVTIHSRCHTTPEQIGGVDDRRHQTDPPRVTSRQSTPLPAAAVAKWERRPTRAPPWGITQTGRTRRHQTITPPPPQKKQRTAASGAAALPPPSLCDTPQPATRSRGGGRQLPPPLYRAAGRSRAAAPSEPAAAAAAAPPAGRPAASGGTTTPGTITLAGGSAGAAATSPSAASPPPSAASPLLSSSSSSPQTAPARPARPPSRRRLPRRLSWPPRRQRHWQRQRERSGRGGRGRGRRPPRRPPARRQRRRARRARVGGGRRAAGVARHPLPQSQPRQRPLLPPPPTGAARPSMRGTRRPRRGRAGGSAQGQTLGGAATGTRLHDGLGAAVWRAVRGWHDNATVAGRVATAIGQSHGGRATAPGGHVPTRGPERKEIEGKRKILHAPIGQE